ncbi:MAG: hypothetical protein DRP02_02185, partial [Candidatus Gerdarchaeota archaeon]
VRLSLGTIVLVAISITGSLTWVARSAWEASREKSELVHRIEDIEAWKVAYETSTEKSTAAQTEALKILAAEVRGLSNNMIAINTVLKISDIKFNNTSSFIQ